MQRESPATLAQRYTYTTARGTAFSEQSFSSSPVLQEAAANMPLPDGGAVLQVADLGCSQGRNSIDPIRVILRTVAARLAGDQRLSVAITHEGAVQAEFPGIDPGCSHIGTITAPAELISVQYWHQWTT